MTPEFRLYGYGPDRIDHEVVEGAPDLDRWLTGYPVTWIDLVGVGSGPELTAIANALKLHPLAVEDVVNLGQRPKFEMWEDHAFVVVRMARADETITEQLSLFFGRGWVATIQERPGDCFDGVRARLGEAGRRIRSRGSDYLAYALVDAVVDSYFPALDALGDRLEELEEQVFAGASDETAQDIHRTRRTLVALRKSIVPHRDTLQLMSRENHPLIEEETRVFLRDVYDHVLRLTDLVETYRDLTGDLMSMYMTVISNRMNEVMKVLTIIATIFIPLGFIAGLYGMNFDPSVSPWNMPELGWRFGYPFALTIMAAVAVGFLLWIGRKGWLK